MPVNVDRPNTNTPLVAGTVNLNAGAVGDAKTNAELDCTTGQPQAELVEIAHSGQLCGWLVLGVIRAGVVFGRAWSNISPVVFSWTVWTDAQ